MRKSQKKGLALNFEKSGDSEAEDSKKSDVPKTDLILNCLAQVMGVKTEEMAKLLDSAGIKPEELAAVSGPEALAAKLTQALGLDAKSGKALEEILQVIVSQVDEAMPEENPPTADTKIEPEDMLEDPVVKIALPEEAKAATKAPERTEAGTADILARVKQKLKEMGEKLESNPDTFTAEITMEIKPVLQAAPVQVKQPVPPEAADLTPENTGLEKEAAEISLPDKKETGDKEAAKSTEHVSDSTTPIAQQAAANPEVPDVNQPVVNAIGQLQSRDATVLNSENVIMEAPVQAKEIISQVVEKARFVITGDKSEMVMDLKPDSMGKLSLKVVTEHGMIMAKFVAESQQVKQVLETNMQFLKDSLEKQGLNVQGFSVSVRQDSQSDRGKYGGQGEGRRMTSAAAGPERSGIYIGAAEDERFQRINPYRQEGSTINLTA